MDTLKAFMDIEREEFIEEHLQAMRDNYAEGNCQQARWHWEKAMELMGKEAAKDSGA